MSAIYTGCFLNGVVMSGSDELATTGLSADLAIVDDVLGSDYYNPLNDYYEVKRREIEGLMSEIVSDMEPWQSVALKMFGDGESTETIKKRIKRSHKKIKTFLESYAAQQFLKVYQYHQTVLTGPSESQRISALWRIYVDNEHSNVNAAIKALSEINSMCKQDKAAGGGNIQIVISNEVLGKGELD